MQVQLFCLVRSLARGLAPVALACLAPAQVFQNASSKVPQGSPFNNSDTAGVDFADVDGDGDFDAAFADGDDAGSDQNRLWINLGGVQGGTIGFFSDETATRFPALLDQSRDLEFADLDGDGDEDVFTSNDSSLTLQSARIWINMGAAQGGQPGFFQDETSTRWIGLGQNNGSTSFSSIAPGQVLASGGFADWSWEALLGDLDQDGDLDLVQTSAGSALNGNSPTRVFLNDGTGHFDEFNPSGYQLSSSIIPDNTPGLWCEGVHVDGTINTTGAQCDIADANTGSDLGDIDGDFDLDLVFASRIGTPRVFLNRWEEKGGVLGFRDVTWSALTEHPPTDYNRDQELGDFDDDGDLDLYGTDWSNTSDIMCRNDGAGVFGAFSLLPNSAGTEDGKGEFLDYDDDGDLDLFVANFSGQDRVFRNDGAPAWSFTNVTASVMPPDSTISTHADACDVDWDGDYDVVVTNTLPYPNILWDNVGQVSDVRAPRLPRLEQIPNRAPSAVPSPARAQVLDNAPWTVTHFNASVLEYRIDAGGLQTVPMVFAGGNLFRGEIPGALAGVIRYRARSADAYGNSGVSPWRAYSSSASPPQTFCTSKPSSIPGCVPVLAGSSSQLSKGAGAGSYSVAAAPVPGTPGSFGILIYTRFGLLGAPLQTNFGALCLSQFARLGSFVSTPGGTLGACDGSYFWDFGAIAQATAAIQSGHTLHLQAWYRDPLSTGAANLTHGIGPIAVVP
jgi:hypothetical protein